MRGVFGIRDPIEFAGIDALEKPGPPEQGLLSTPFPLTSDTGGGVARAPSWKVFDDVQ